MDVDQSTILNFCQGERRTKGGGTVHVCVTVFSCSFFWEGGGVDVLVVHICGVDVVVHGTS